MQFSCGYGRGEEAREASGLIFERTGLRRMCRLPKETKPLGLRSLTVAFVFLLASAVNSPGQQATQSEGPKQSALELEKEGKTTEAEAVWRSLVKSNPNNSEAYAHLGLLEARQEHYKEAIANYRKALSLNPKIPGLRLNLGLSLFKAGELRSAIETFETLLKSGTITPPEKLRLVTLIGMAEFGLGNYAASVPYLQQAAAGDPKNSSLRMTLAQGCLLSKQYQCVLDVYHELLSLNADSAESHMLAGEAYDELSNDSEAVAEFQAAVKYDPAPANAHFGYGYLLFRLSRYDEADKEFRAELAMNAEHPLALAYLGDTEIHLNHPDQAVTYLEHAVRVQSSIAIAHRDLGTIYDGQGRKDDALRELTTAKQLSPDDTSIHWALGRLYKSMGRAADANVEFAKTKNLQQAKDQSLREKMRQVEVKPGGQSADSGPR